MKKLVLSFAAIGLFFTATQAQVVSETTTTTEVSTTEVTVQDDYSQIEVAELPATVTAAITRDFVGAVTQEAWVKEKDGKVVYKIKLNVNGEEQKLYADAEGNWIDKKDKKDKNKDS
ncbi:hypothetical protein FK178_11285 [Antarcticibacterium arcticum]|uniref:Beta-lactamase-inhibitor-like PepSY-like domain-containing protein n=1 Tax=Antarcticibacterium arcticum TaxID=2585771 RepID=A0A5B8YQL8_9FLAO|nr:hypothetical protein [Antarcticibacterium arcticum]QED38259.1 hypothetical protein FK178_11285 [Antarcticibacterium arcticum]